MNNKVLVVYYSNTGSNRYLANKIAEHLDCETEEIHPRSNALPLLILGGFMGLSPGIKKLKKDISKFDKIIMCGPIWTGQFITSLKSFLKKYNSQIKKLYFVTCCGSHGDEKDGKFGYESVFDKMRKVAAANEISCKAFPISMVLPDELKDDADTVMKTRLNDKNFKGEIVERLSAFVAEIN